MALIVSGSFPPLSLQPLLLFLFVALSCSFLANSHRDGTSDILYFRRMCFVQQLVWAWTGKTRVSRHRSENRLPLYCGMVASVEVVPLDFTARVVAAKGLLAQGLHGIRLSIAVYSNIKIT
jgi:hypothetical protein